MKYITFYRESNKFDDIINDVSFKKHIDEVTTWYQYCRITLHSDVNDTIYSYMTIKYGDEMVNKLTNDYSPVINVDYTPKR